MRERQLELMILDINLSDGLGWSVLDSMRVDRRDTKMAVIVATSDRMTRSQLRECQVERHLTKPFDLGQMMATVAELLPMDRPCRQETEPVR
ncbi:MAG: response regulator [SAR202 cluster bacterium]|nr:response regulator [SAR202 cluster bacterium]